MKRTSLAALAAMTLAAFAPTALNAAMQIRKKAPEPAPADQTAPAAAQAPASAPASAPAAQPEKAASREEAAKPAAKVAPAPAAAEKPKAESFIGSVSFVQGKKVLVESGSELSPKQRLIAYDDRLSKRGILKIGSSKGKNVYIATVTAGGVLTGDRLVKETEEEAFQRVSRSRSAATVKEFLELYPDSPKKQDIALKLFRIALRSNFPAGEGSSRISGKVNLGEKVGQKIEMGRAMIKLDRFLIAMTDEDGKYVIEGIPQLVLPVKVGLSVSDTKFQSGGETFVELPGEKAASLESDISVTLTPTYLTGKVVDDKGQPLRGVQVWTSPYTMEKLTDENGEFKIWRKKKLDDSGNPTEGDEPLLGRDYEIFAYKSGYGAEKAPIGAESFKDNVAKPVVLVKQSSIGDSLPAPAVGLRENLDLMQYVVSAGAGPKINR